MGEDGGVEVLEVGGGRVLVEVGVVLGGRRARRRRRRVRTRWRLEAGLRTAGMVVVGVVVRRGGSGSRRSWGYAKMLNAENAENAENARYANMLGGICWGNMQVGWLVCRRRQQQHKQLAVVVIDANANAALGG